MAEKVTVTKISDLDGKEGADVEVVLRKYPGQEQDKALDVTAEQLEALAAKALKNAVTVEVRNGDTSTREIQVSKTELDKWLGNPDEVLQAARFLRGRRPGYSPTRNGNGG